MSFGNKLKILRVCNKLDQETISKKLNISQPVYSRYENDEKEVSADNPLVQRISEEFNVPANWLVSDSTENFLSDSNKEYKSSSDPYYHIPKDFLEAFLQQQKLTEQMLKLLTKKKAG